MCGCMGVKVFFSKEGGAVEDFPKILSRGGQKWWNLFFTLEIEKTTFFANNFKIQGVQTPLPSFWRPWMCAP